MPPAADAGLDLRAARAGRRSRTRRLQSAKRARRRRQLGRLLVLSFGLALALAVVSGPQSARSPARRSAVSPRAARCPVPGPLRPAFLQAAQETGVPLPLLTAVAHVESHFDPQARSRTGAVGVLQLMPATAASLHYDPQETSANVIAGALYLRQMISRFGSTDLALAAYNAGPTVVDRLGASPSAETAAYVERVQRARRRYGDCA